MYSVGFERPADFDAWRDSARRLRMAGISPGMVSWRHGDGAGLFGDVRAPDTRNGDLFTVPRAFVDLARDLVCHRDEDRFDLMYRLLIRLESEPQLMGFLTDRDMVRARSMQRQVRQAIHKMHAFVRFRDVAGADKETLAAWFEPPHYVIERGVTHFVKRLANLRFSIISPYIGAHWDGALRFGPGGSAADVPGEDAREDEWRIYFTNIFNPARLNPKVMTQHMAKGYWRNLPEAAIIPQMVSTAQARANSMVQSAPTLPSRRTRRVIEARERREAAPNTTADAPTTLGQIAAAIQACRRCDLWRDATQGVAGEGLQQARVMIVGEQPGDQEDLAGHPFVGPAGQMLDRALSEAGIDRAEVFVTNAVKHFKHEPRGKRRLHAKPNTGEVEACKWWLRHELKLVRPKLIIALGATAARAVLDREISPVRERGMSADLVNGAKVLVTVHPSYLLRIPDREAKAAAYAAFVQDLRRAA